ncbi:MAG: lipid A-modifier LpxR family protein [Parvibaculales bacterium]
MKFPIMKTLRIFLMLSAFLSTSFQLAHAQYGYLSFANEDKGIFTSTSEAIYGSDNSDGNLSASVYFAYFPESADPDIQYLFSIQQDAFTPGHEAKKSPTAVPGRRSFAGYLALNAVRFKRHNDLHQGNLFKIGNQTNMEVRAGVIGPASKVQAFQDFFHDIIGATDYQGWNDQIVNRYGGSMRIDQLFPIGVSAFEKNDLEITPHITLVAGNLLQYASAGLQLRIGDDLEDFGGQRFNYYTGGETPVGPAKWQLYAGWERRFMDRNYTLDGKTKETQIVSAQKTDEYDETQVGVRTKLGDYVLDISLVQRGLEFTTQDSKQQFVRIGLGRKF